MQTSRYIPGHATVAAYLALFASVSTGGAFAATQLAYNSVGSEQIRPGSVRLSDLSPATVRALRRQARGEAKNPAPHSATSEPTQARD